MTTAPSETDWRACRAAAVEWMAVRGWTQLLAKKADFEQSLFHHTLVQIDVWLQLFPELSKPNHFGLTESEKRAVFVGSLAHDCGKSALAWQEYIARGGEPNAEDDDHKVSHIVPELTEAVVRELWPTLGFGTANDAPLAEIDQYVRLHHQALRTDGAIFQAVMARAQGSLSDRWNTLSRLVDSVDNLVSAAGPVGADAAAKRGILGSHFSFAYHLCSPRGVSTSFLHRAAQRTYDDAGFRALIHYSEGTLYWAPAEQSATAPTVEEIREKLAEELGLGLPSNVAKLVVGSPTATIMPKPELFNPSQIRDYLAVARNKIGRASFGRKKEEDRLRVAKEYFKLAGTNEPSREELLRQSDRIGQAQPDMVLFKFFKAVMQLPALTDSARSVAEREYDLWFGPGSFKALMSTSTLMAAQDMYKTVDPFYKLPYDGGLTVESVAPELRSQKLIDVLSEITATVFRELKSNDASKATPGRMAEAFIKDLQIPHEQSANPTDDAAMDVAAWAASKPVLGKAAGTHQGFCPLCNRRFEQGHQAIADLIGKPEGFSNRALVHDSFGRITVCSACREERVLRQLLLGSRPAALICLIPPMDLGHQTGLELIQKANDLISAATAEMFRRRVQLGNVGQLLDRLDQWQNLDPASFARLASFSIDAEIAKKRDQLRAALESEYGLLDDLNSEWGTDLPSWDATVDALIGGGVHDTVAIELRQQAFGAGAPLHLVCQTPNLVVLGLAQPLSVNSKESETVRGLRELCVALILGQSFGCSVAFLQPDEPLEFLRPRGVARTPRIPAIREFVGADWVPTTRATNITNLIVLGSRLAYLADYPVSNGLLEVLSTKRPGEILRHLETRRERMATLDEIKYLRRFEKELAG